MILIIGDSCRPKYFGASKLSVRLGEERTVQFYWQESYAEYYSACLSKGLFYIVNSGKLSWVGTAEKEATIFPEIEQVYSSVSRLSMNYRGETKLLTLSVYRLYKIPTPPILPRFPLITSSFGDITQAWVPDLS